VTGEEDLKGWNGSRARACSELAYREAGGRPLPGEVWWKHSGGGAGHGARNFVEVVGTRDARRLGEDTRWGAYVVGEGGKNGPVAAVVEARMGSGTKNQGEDKLGMGRFEVCCRGGRRAPGFAGAQGWCWGKGSSRGVIGSVVCLVVK